MAKTSGEAYRNARALSEFFGLFSVVSKADVDDFINRHERKKYLKQTLDRFEKHGLVENRRGAYTTTTKGKAFFSRYQRNGHGHISRRWDGRWRLVSFDVPNRHRDKRDILRSSLKEAGFYQLQKSVWIAPYEMTKEFWRFVVMNGLHKYCKVMLIEVLEGDEGLRKHFKLAE